MLKITTNLKNIFYEDKEMQDIMKKYYQIKRNFILSILFLIKHNCILSRQVVYKKRRGVAEQYYKRMADWKEAGEERSDERPGILSDNISDEVE